MHKRQENKDKRKEKKTLQIILVFCLIYLKCEENVQVLIDCLVLNIQQ